MPPRATVDKTTPEPVTGTAAIVDNVDTTWEMVREESPDKIVFDEEGDQLIGRFVGREIITVEEKVDANGKITEPESTFTVLTWRDCLVNGDKMEYVANNAGFALEKAFASLPFGVITRVTLIKKTDVGQQSKMNDFRVEVARNSANHAG
jgi:hypothetical protein